METMVILGRKTEDGECTTSILFSLTAIAISKKSRNSEFMSFDLQACGFIDGLECH
jgi:hypothetical protein